MSAFLTVRIDGDKIKTSNEFKELEIYAGVGQMAGVVESLGMNFMLPSTLIYDIIKRECDGMNTPNSISFFEEFDKRFTTDHQ